jgi:hypothetical protein
VSGLLATVRPDEQVVPLILHVAGATILVGALLSGVATLAYARGDAALLRVGYWTLLVVGLPGYVLMRIGAEWIYSEQGWDEVEDEPAWLGIGYVTADLGLVLFLISLIVGGIGVYRLREGKGAGLLKATLILALILLAALVVAAWAMAAKPD